VLLANEGIAAISELNGAKQAGLKLLALHYGEQLFTDGAFQLLDIDVLCALSLCSFKGSGFLAEGVACTLHAMPLKCLLGSSDCCPTKFIA
jgi:hypothetical protein